MRTKVRVKREKSVAFSCAVSNSIAEALSSEATPGQRVAMRCLSRAHCSLECDQYDFRICSEAHRRAPRAGAARRVNEEVAEPLQAVNERPVNSRRNPRERKELPAVRVPGKLQADFLIGRDGQVMWRVRQQNARDLGIEAGATQHSPIMLGLHGI